MIAVASLTSLSDQAEASLGRFFFERDVCSSRIWDTKPISRGPKLVVEAGVGMLVTVPFKSAQEEVLGKKRIVLLDLATQLRTAICALARFSNLPKL